MHFPTVIVLSGSIFLTACQTTPSSTVPEIPRQFTPEQRAALVSGELRVIPESRQRGGAAMRQEAYVHALIPHADSTDANPGALSVQVESHDADRADADLMAMNEALQTLAQMQAETTSAPAK